jgi:colanic acid biosynthesis glycosyl transferase WcaI
MRKIWIVSEVYYPDEQGTAYYMTGLAEGLTPHFDVNVLSGYPTVTARGTPVRRKETLNGVRIIRCRGTAFNKEVVLLRLINLLTSSISVLFTGMLKIRKGDMVLSVTGPHILHYLIRITAFLRGAKSILRVDDVYPDALVVMGMVGRKSPIALGLAGANRILYRSADCIVALGRDMKALILKKLGSRADHVIIIPNWADIDSVIPTPKTDNPLLRELRLADKFVVQCAGNMGRAQGIENMFAAAGLLKDEPDISFLFVGSGARRPWMENEAQNKNLGNVALLNQRPRSDQSLFLNACDIAMVSLLKGMNGEGVPSRMYNIMAAGKPVIVIANYDSESAMVVMEEGIGWVVPPDRPEQLANAIMSARSDPERLARMGRRARRAAETKYSRDIIVEAYKALIENIR